MKSASAAANRRARSAANATQRQRDERARRIALPLALIERPLRLVLSRTEIRNERGELIGHEPNGRMAALDAKRGHGTHVRAAAWRYA